jgi:tRNA pseudouridine55 synthase
MYDFLKGETLLINKPYEWTSFDAVNKIRNTLENIKTAEGERPYRKIKVGHAGTLDPLATGLLIICTGASTKKINELVGMEKEYTGIFYFGATTPSFDKESEVNATYETSHLTEKILQDALIPFMGTTLQTPPAHSATSINGERAYEMARRGEEVILKPKEITITEFEITKIEMPEVHFRVVCSKGTYIRSLAFDLGKAVGSGAYLSALCRTRIGNFNLENAKGVLEFCNEIKFCHV